VPTTYYTVPISTQVCTLESQLWRQPVTRGKRPREEVQARPVPPAHTEGQTFTVGVPGVSGREGKAWGWNYVLLLRPLSKRACASRGQTGTPEQTTSVSRCQGVVSVSLRCLAALEAAAIGTRPQVLYSATCRPGSRVRRYVHRYTTTTTTNHHSAAGQEHFGGESDPGPWIPPLPGTTCTRC
jgi:hypothetical protein